MYHRIAELDRDPWGLAVSPAHFAQHLYVLRRLGSVISLPDLVQALRSGDVPRRPIIVTFDDGYADNVDTAMPLLEQHAILATIFLTTGAIASGREFWWDELERVLLEPRDLLEFSTFGSLIGAIAAISPRCDLWQGGVPEESIMERVGTTRCGTRSITIVAAALRAAGPSKRALLDELLDWAGLDPVMRPSHRLVSVDEVKQLGRSMSIEVGAHTVTHPALPELTIAVQAEEIRQSKLFVEDLLNRPVTYFAYPHGHHDSSTLSIVRKAGFTSACTTAARPVCEQSDCFALPRFQVLNWNGNEFRERLQAWQDADA
jgi:peptidoglycan/xylan/chitin deacetylase (PgdA/CDA1 family)